MKAKITEWDLQVDERGNKLIIFTLTLPNGKSRKFPFVIGGRGIYHFLRMCRVRNWRTISSFYPDKLIGRVIEIPERRTSYE